MISENCLVFEENLTREYKKNPNPELAEVLIKEFASHFIKKNQSSVQLEKWIKKEA